MSGTTEITGRTSGNLSKSVKVNTDGSLSQGAATVPSTATTMQSGATANGNGTILDVQGYATAIFNIASSPSMSGGTTVNFEGSTDNFVSDISPVIAHQLGAQGNQVTTTSTDGDYRINVAGLKQVRARISGYSVGAVTVKGYVSPLAGPATTVGISGASDTAQTDATQTTSIGSFIKGLVKLISDALNRTFNVNNHVTITSSTSETTILSAVAATYLDLYGLIITNTSATACNVTIKDDTGGTTRFVFAVGAGDTKGFVIPKESAHNQAVLNKSWTATCSASVASIDITALAVKRT